MRNGRGQWRSGYSGNPRGRPAVPARVTGMRSALIDAVSPEDVAAIAQGLVAAAKGGDTAAAKVLLAYCVGRAVGDFDPAEHGEPVSPALAQQLATLERETPSEQVRTLREVADRLETDGRDAAKLAQQLVALERHPPAEQARALREAADRLEAWIEDEPCAVGDFETTTSELEADIPADPKAAE